jgi:hypothetical protein
MVKKLIDFVLYLRGTYAHSPDASALTCKFPYHGMWSKSKASGEQENVKNQHQDHAKKCGYHKKFV